MLKSIKNEDDAIKLVSDVRQMCQNGGFKLTKFICNSRKILQTIQKDDTAASVRNIDLGCDKLPVERALEIHWNIQNDEFGCNINIKQKPTTRRGVLSTLSSVFDPLGMASPFMLVGKKLLQEICSERKKWDDSLSPQQMKAWETWKSQLLALDELKIPRRFKP